MSELLFFILGFVIGGIVGFGAFFLYMKRLTKKIEIDFEHLDKILDELFKKK